MSRERDEQEKVPAGGLPGSAGEQPEGEQDGGQSGADGVIPEGGPEKSGRDGVIPEGEG